MPTCNSISDKRAKPGQPCTKLVYPALLTYNSKLVHSATEHTQNEASKEANQLYVQLNLKLKAKNARRYLLFG